MPKRNREDEKQRRKEEILKRRKRSEEYDFTFDEITEDNMVVEDNSDILTGVPPKSSIYLVTINTNKTENALADEYLQSSLKSYDAFKVDFFTAIDDTLRDKNNYVPVKDLELSAAGDILAISISSGCWEVGKSMGRLHLHLKVEVVYTGSTSGFFHLNRSRIESQIRATLPGMNWGKAPYVNIRFLKSAAETSVLNYINKEIQKNPDFSLIQRNYEQQAKRRESRRGNSYSRR